VRDGRSIQRLTHRSWPRPGLRSETKVSYNGEGGIHELAPGIPRRAAAQL